MISLQDQLADLNEGVRLKLARPFIDEPLQRSHDGTKFPRVNAKYGKSAFGKI